MSHSATNFATLVNGWTVQTRSPDVEHLQKILNEGGKTDPAQTGGTRIDLDVEMAFTSLDPVVMLFDGSAATGQIYAYLDLHMLNRSGTAWTKFNMSAIDQVSSPDASDYNANVAHPYFSHFHHVDENTFDLFPRSGWNSVLGTPEPNNAPNSWEFSGGGTLPNGSADTLDFLNFRTHQYNKGFGGRDAGGTFYVVLTPNQSRIDYSGYVVTEDTANADFLGGDKNDTLPRKDMLFGYRGDDLLKGFELSDRLYGGTGNDRLFGGNGADTLSGGSGTDLLSGDSGADVMRGGTGNDTYIVDSAADLALEASGQGIDRVHTSVSYQLRLGQEIETLAATSSGSTSPLKLTGNERSQTITGNAGINKIDGRAGNDTAIGLAGSDQLTGGSGNDTLRGGLGSDRLTGSSGDDEFVFDTRLGNSNIDKIKDFRPDQDRIMLDKSSIAFTKLIGGGTLSSGQFKDITDPDTELDGNDRILYNHDTGRLYYDADGSGGIGKVQFALLETSPVLQHDDFRII